MISEVNNNLPYMYFILLVGAADSVKMCRKLCLENCLFSIFYELTCTFTFWYLFEFQHFYANCYVYIEINNMFV